VTELAKHLERMNPLVADPRWGWWIIWYFYLGGIAAGAYFMATLVEFVGDELDRRLARRGYFLAAPLIGLCGVLLIVDLEQPSRFWHMLFDAETLRPHVKYWSPMSVGAWALLVFGMVSAVSFAGALAEDGRLGLGRWAELATRLHRGVLGRTFDLVGCICGFFTASYTGALLTATNQPIWSDSPWIAALFLASSATTGIAAIQLTTGRKDSGFESARAKLEQADRWALVLELLTLVLFLASIRAFLPELIGRWPFLCLLVGTLACGVCLPLVLGYLPQQFRKRTPAVAALLVLLGGFVLRYSLLAAAPDMLDARHTAAPGNPGRQAPDSGSENTEIARLFSLVRERLVLHLSERSKSLGTQLLLAEWLF